MNRRIGAALAATSLIALAACGSSSSDDEASGGPWNYTDGRGEKISLDATPKRIVAQSSMAAALNDLGVKGIVGTFGPLKGADGGVDRQADGLELSKVTDVTGGGDYGDVNLEDLAGLNPDIVATYQYLPDQLWYMSPKVAADVDKLVPTAVVDFEGKTLIETLDAVEALAKKFGADIDSPAIEKSHQDFEDAAARLKAAGDKLGDKKIIATSPSPDIFFVSDPHKSPDLSYYLEELGLPIVEPQGLKQADYFESLSWEKADKYDGEIALYDARVGAEGLKTYDKQPVWQKVEAGKNKAYVPWQSVAPPSYESYAKIMNEIAAGIEDNL